MLLFFCKLSLVSHLAIKIMLHYSRRISVTSLSFFETKSHTSSLSLVRLIVSSQINTGMWPCCSLVAHLFFVSNHRKYLYFFSFFSVSKIIPGTNLTFYYLSVFMIEKFQKMALVIWNNTSQAAVWFISLPHNKLKMENGRHCAHCSCCFTKTTTAEALVLPEQLLVRLDCEVHLED